MVRGKIPNSGLHRLMHDKSTMHLFSRSKYRKCPDRLDQKFILPRPHIPMHVARSIIINRAQTIANSLKFCMVASNSGIQGSLGVYFWKNNLNKKTSLITKLNKTRLATGICTSKFRPADILEAQTYQQSTRWVPTGWIMTGML